MIGSEIGHITKSLPLKFKGIFYVPSGIKRPPTHLSNKHFVDKVNACAGVD
jgi:hypothetical protein